MESNSIDIKKVKKIRRLIYWQEKENQKEENKKKQSEMIELIDRIIRNNVDQRG